MAFKKLAIGNDHVAVDMKNEIMAYLQEKGYEVINVGTDSPERFNYPVSGYKVARMVADGEVDGGILICGTGVGISLSANKVQGIRCVTCSEPSSTTTPTSWPSAPVSSASRPPRTLLTPGLAPSTRVAVTRCAST